MLKGVLSRIAYNASILEQQIAVALGIRWPPVAPEFALVGDLSESSGARKPLAQTVLDEICDGFLWAVPKHRRSLERRKMRMYGYLEQHYKLIRPKKNLLTCMQCGHWHEPGILCAHCYSKVREETNLLKKQIVQTLGLQPIEQDVVVLYKEDMDPKSREFFEGKRIIEVDRPRPSWWNGNLTQPSTQEPSDSKEIKPLDLS